MKISTFLFLFTALLVSCSGVKKTQSMISDGNYDGAFSKAIENLRTNKNAKGKQDYIYLLEETYAKAKQRDEDAVSIMQREANPANLEKLYNTYLLLQSRQDKIKALLPLTLIKENREARFQFNDYSSQIIDTKTKLSSYLYENAKKLMKNNDKMSYRQAYDDLYYLNDLNNNYKDVVNLMNEAYAKGLDYVFVSTKNETNMALPSRLEKDMLDFSTFGIDDKWTVYHNNKQRNIAYDFDMVINYRNISISPEQVKEREFIKEKQVKDGTKPQLDSNGNQIKDDKGNVIMVDNMKTVKATVYEFRQFKSCQVTAKIDYVNNRTKQLIDSFPLVSEYVFENIYARYNGDKRASDNDYLRYFDQRVVPFPSNEQMIYDSGEGVKEKLKSIISRNKFRR